MAASDYVPIFLKNRLHLAGRPQMGKRPGWMNGNVRASSADTGRPTLWHRAVLQGLRLALAKSVPAITVTILLMADAVTAANSGQKTPDGDSCFKSAGRSQTQFR
jgi:hypothetical protein